MNSRLIFLVFTSLCLFGMCNENTFAADVVRRSGEGARSQSGSIVEITVSSVKIKRGMTGVITEIPADEITATQFEDEPPTLSAVRTAVQGSRFPEALENAEKINRQTLKNPNVLADYDYFIAYAKSRSALMNRTQSRTKELEEAASAVTEFLRTHASSYHFFPMCETLGEVQLALGAKDKAAQAYANLARAPWPPTRLEGKYRLGRIYLDREPPEDESVAKARNLFQEILDDKFENVTSEQREKIERRQALAGVALARCLILDGKIDQAVERLETLSEKTSPEETQAQAAIYLALGEAYEKSEKPKDAILAYLHVEILFPAAREEYRTALQKLAVLWKTVNRPERALETERLLRDAFE